MQPAVSPLTSADALGLRATDVPAQVHEGELAQASAPVDAEAAPGAPAETLSWTVHPAADDPVRAALLVAALAVASALAFEYSGSAALGILGFFMLALSLRSWFLPRRYVLDTEGAGESGPLCAPRRLAWSDVRSVGRGRFGIYLSTLHSRSRFVRDRGLFLRTANMRPAPGTGSGPDAPAPRIDRESVLAFVEGAVKAT